MADPFEAALKAAAKRIRKAAAKGLEGATSEVLQDARNRCPTGSTGALRASGQMRVDTETLTAGVGFGSGRSADYALDVHEDMNNTHDDGGPKFLELAVEQTGRDRGAQIIGRAIQGAIQ